MSGTVQRAAEKAVTERYEALLRVSQTLISIRSSEELFRVLAGELRAVVKFYVMGIGIYDEKAHEVRLASYGEPGVPPRKAVGFCRVSNPLRFRTLLSLGVALPRITVRDSLKQPEEL